MSKNKIGSDSPILKFIYLKIRRRDGVESFTILEEGEFKVPIDRCINKRPSLPEAVQAEASSLQYKAQWRARWRARGILKYGCNLRLYPFNVGDKLFILNFIILPIWQNFLTLLYYGKRFGSPLRTTQNFSTPPHFAQPPLHQGIFWTLP